MSYMDNAGMVTYNADLATRGLMPPEAGGGIQTVEYFEDFFGEVDATGSVEWTLTALTAGALTTVAAHGGVLGVDAGSATDNQGVASAQPDSLGIFQAVAGREIYCEMRVNREVQGAGQFWGLAEVDTGAMSTTHFEAKGIGFVCDAGSSALTALDTITTATATANTGEEVTVDVATAMVSNDKFRIYGMRINGTSEVEFFIDGVSVAVHTTNIPDGMLVPTFCCVNGASLRSKLKVDYIYARADR